MTAVLHLGAEGGEGEAGHLEALYADGDAHDGDAPEHAHERPGQGEPDPGEDEPDDVAEEVDDTHGGSFLERSVH